MKWGVSHGVSFMCNNVIINEKGRPNYENYFGKEAEDGGNGPPPPSGLRDGYFQRNPKRSRNRRVRWEEEEGLASFKEGGQ